ncbi:MBL fold metallo-hydrolase [Devosia ginsengisoli]|uniref:MBL fold metallo-hydrolase n=1 Tax=Devosia ginsengisoli TaxID=400770 RepID=UPI0026EAFE01|nr:MBL fold metallo-hydrolase [Devosia ginsengisoli]MCR6673476.1 MBL fold metallo-hydrolase [Devosia ginsengisoli]
MASPTPVLSFDRDFDPQTGQPVPVADGIIRITAPNASAYTFTGTNSFLLGHERLALVDPGPDDPIHLVALIDAIGGRPLEAILLSHTHRDHSASAARLARDLGVPLWFGGRHRLSRPLRRFERNPIRKSCNWNLVPNRTLVDGESIMAGDLPITVHTTPGHCANHLAFSVGDILLSGDHVMGWNSTLVSVPDGSMADYFASLDKVIALPCRQYIPAHGGPIADGPAYATALKAHRQMRNEQVIASVKAGARTIKAIVAAIYPAQPLPVRRAAGLTITAHVEYLEGLGLLKVSRGLLGTRITAEA